MAKTQTSRRDEQYQVGRRTLIKWSLAAGAALGVSRSKIFDILERSAGKGVAFAASEAPTCRSVHFVAGNGGLAHTQLMWPFPQIAKTNNAAFSWSTPGVATDVTGITKPLVTGGDTPWTSLPAARQVTGFLMGANETHTKTPASSTQLNGAGIFAIASALQVASPTTIPMLLVGGTSQGTATGAASASAVANGDSIITLFNSAASRMGGTLSNTADAALYKAHYDAFIQLNRAANRSTTKTAYTTGDGAAGTLGTNLSAVLQTTPADLTRYGITAATRANVTAIARTLIVTAKAFTNGLTNSVVLPYMDDDPHTMFDSGDFKIVPGQLKGVLQAFMDDLTKNVDDNTQQSLADDTVITWHGDTFKTPVNRAGWGDNTPNNSNLVLIYSAGHLLPGWNGEVDATGKASGVDATGKPGLAYDGATMAKFGLASIAYAIAKRDDRAIQNFTSGITVGGVFGNLKDK